MHSSIDPSPREGLTGLCVFVTSSILFAIRSGSTDTTVPFDTADTGNLSQYIGPSRSSSDNDGDSEGSDSSAILRAEMDRIRFPWEPVENPLGGTPTVSEVTWKERGDSTTLIERPPEVLNEGKTDAEDKKRRHQDQLDFIGSMTFAVGSLREPKCPCCI